MALPCVMTCMVRTRWPNAAISRSHTCYIRRSDTDVVTHTRSPAILFLGRWLFVSTPVGGCNSSNAFPASLGCSDMSGISRSGGRRDEEEVVQDGELAE